MPTDTEGEFLRSPGCLYCQRHDTGNGEGLEAKGWLMHLPEGAPGAAMPCSQERVPLDGNGTAPGRRQSGSLGTGAAFACPGAGLTPAGSSRQHLFHPRKQHPQIAPAPSFASPFPGRGRLGLAPSQRGSHEGLKGPASNQLLRKCQPRGPDPESLLGHSHANLGP